MDKQSNLLIFQKPFELSSKSSALAYPNLVQEAEQVLLGSLLGDGCLIKEKYKKYKGNIRWDNVIPRYREKHCLKQEEYFLWKINILKFILRIKTYFEINMTGKGGHKTICLTSLHHPFLKNYYNLFYPNGKKVVTEEVLNKLTPLGIAIWYCDDGSYDYRIKYAKIHTNGFTYEENGLIQNWFSEKFGIECKVGRKGDRRYNKDYYQIMIPRPDKFFRLIKEYVPKCMDYKLGNDIKKRNNVEKQLKEYELKRRFLPERIKYLKQHYKDYYWKNREILTIKKKEYYEKNKEKINKKHREWRNNNREILRKYNKEYYLKNKELLNKRNREYINKNRDKLRKHWREYSRERYRKKKLFEEKYVR